VEKILVNHNDYAALIRARAKHVAGINDRVLSTLPAVDTIIYQAAYICALRANIDENEATMASAAEAVGEIWKRLK